LKPLIDLLQWVIDSPADMFSDFQRRAANKNMGRVEITNFFSSVPSTKDKESSGSAPKCPKRKSVSSKKSESSGGGGIERFFSPNKKQRGEGES